MDAYGKIDPKQNWGFTTFSGQEAATSRMTRSVRARLPEAPTFRDANPIEKPAMPTFSSTVPDGTTYAKNIGQNEWANGDVVYIDANYASVDGNAVGLTIYADGDVSFDGIVSQNAPRTTIIVTENSTLSLQTVRNNINVYLAPGATLDLNGLADGATFNNGVIYMSRGSKIKGGSVTFFNGSQVLNDGGTIAATNLSVDKSSTLWNEGVITVTEMLSCVNEDAFIYNAANKTITAGSLCLINNTDLLYNNGTVTATDSISLQNTSAEIVNNGKLSSAYLSMKAGGKMHNVGETNISGKTDLTNSNSQWRNDGQYTSGSFDVDNYSSRNYNNCRLTVIGDFYLNRGEFVLDEGASLVCGSFTWEDTSNFWMNSSSLVKVKGTLLTHNCNVDYGFHGIGERYAVIQAEAIARETDDQFRMSYFGNLYVDTDNHFSQWYKDAPGMNTRQPEYYYDSTVKFSFSDPLDQNVTASAAPVSIPASGCSPGYGSIAIPVDQGEVSEDKVTIKTTKEYYETTELIEQGRVFCEDLGRISSNDLDFNDAVFDAYIYKITPSVRTLVTEDNVVVSDQTEYGTPTYKTTIVLLAAGGTLTLSVAGREVHNALGGNDPSTIINTIVDESGSYNNRWTTSDPVVLGTDFTYRSIVEIPIRVLYSNGTTLELGAEEGWAPHKIKTPIGTKWARERVKVDEAYTDFHKYVEYSEDCWNTNVVTDNVYSHPKDTYQPRSMEPVTVLVNTEGPVTTYRSKGTTTTTGGYQNEEVLTRRTKNLFND